MVDKINPLILILKKELQNGTYPIGSHFPSEYELADMFLINKKTANKAVSILVEEGYLERKRGRGGTVVRRTFKYPNHHILLIMSVDVRFYAKIANGIQTAALQDNSLVSIAAPELGQISSLMKNAKSIGINGIISSGFGILPDEGLPVIYLEDRLGNTTYPEYVACDSYSGGYKIMKEVLSRGHRDIVILFHMLNNPDRMNGMYDAMKENGIADYRERTFVLNESSVAETNIILRRIRKQYPGVTAFIACSDDDSYRMIQSMNSQKIDWIGKIAVCGFGNIQGISDVFSMASVEQHPFLIGIESYRHLVNKIRNPELVVKKLLEVDLVQTGNIPVISGS